MNDKNEPVELCSSVECKGIIGNDGRHYILDLLRTFPPDVNFLKRKKLNHLIFFHIKILKLLFFLVDEQLSKEIRHLGFPIEHKHKLCCLRQELIDCFVDSRYMMFIKYAAFHLQQLTLKKRQETEAVKNKEVKNSENEVEKNGSQLETEEARKIIAKISSGSQLECKFVVVICLNRKISLIFFSGRKYKECIENGSRCSRISKRK